MPTNPFTDIWHFLTDSENCYLTGPDHQFRNRKLLRHSDYLSNSLSWLTGKKFQRTGNFGARTANAQRLAAHSKRFRFSLERGPIAAMFFAAGATTGSRTLPHCAATSPLYPDVRYTPVGSTDRRNTFCELLSWGLKEQGLSRPFIELPGDRTELGLAMQ